MDRKFGDVMREARTAAKVSMGDLSRQLDLSVPYISDIERNRRNPPSEEVVRHIAALLGLDPDDFVVVAARTRERLELEMRAPTQAQQKLATALTRKWATVTDAEAAEVCRVLEGRVTDPGKEGEHGREPA
jgi:transcriptional regulator with XRE-family HTH domain